MKLYEFNENKFPVYAVIYANNEAEAYRYYESSIEELCNNYNVPYVLDINEFYEKLKHKLSYYNILQINTKFSNLCVDIFSKNKVKRLI